MQQVIDADVQNAKDLFGGLEVKGNSLFRFIRELMTW